MTRSTVARPLVLVGTVSATVVGYQQTAQRAVLPDLQSGIVGWM